MVNAKLVMVQFSKAKIVRKKLVMDKIVMDKIVRIEQ